LPSTITLRSIVDYNRTRTRMVQLVNVGGIPNQPALDICNDVLQTLLSAPNNWKFNKSSLPQFTTIQNQQDYTIAGASMAITSSSGVQKAIVALNSVLSTVPGLTQSGTTVTATFSDFAPNGTQGISSVNNIVPGDSVTVTGAADSKYNITATVLSVPSVNSVTYTAAGGAVTPDGGQGINNQGWIEHCTLQDFLSTAPVRPVHDIEVVSSLPNESIIQPPFKVAMQAETIQSSANQNVVQLLMRMWPVPSSQIWNVLTFYQNKPPVRTSLDQTWSPWPDELGYVLRSGVYAKALDHAEDPRAPMADAKWQQDVLRALDIRQQEARHEAFFPDLPILRGG
jgi:hypothetical protein